MHLYQIYLVHPSNQVQHSDSPEAELSHMPQDWICLSTVVQLDMCCEMSWWNNQSMDDPFPEIERPQNWTTCIISKSEKNCNYVQKQDEFPRQLIKHIFRYVHLVNSAMLWINRRVIFTTKITEIIKKLSYIINIHI